MPYNFASAIMTLPSMIAGITPTPVDDKLFAVGSALYLVLYGLLIFFLHFFTVQLLWIQLKLLTI